ncbi:MAG: polysaccharide lyase family 8 super-sandwich domain-containing protein [Rariglobus sp.]
MASTDLQRLREQLRRKILEDRPADRTASGKITLPSANGTWPDIDYTSRARTVWAPNQHLLRTNAIAVKAIATGNQEWIDATLRALGWWVEHDPMSDNWWHNQIGAPRLFANALLLVADHAPVSLIADGQKITDRSGAFLLRDDGTRAPRNWTGANLLWLSANQLLAGALTADESLIEHAITAALTEVRISTRTEEGIQVDGSFHQHGPLLYNGSYGAAFLNECLFFFEATRGTRWAPDGRYHALLTDFILDGTRWMLRGADFNPGCIDRVITRFHQTAEGLSSVAAFLAETDGPRRAELVDFARALDAGAAPGNLRGNRMFYRSDFMVQQEESSCVSVRMHSRRTVRAECCNDEGKLSHHISDGLTYLHRTGAEYREIFPVWDWQKLPGITCLQTPKPEPRETVSIRASASSVGGVSDGVHGACTQHLFSDHLEARKSWFFGPTGVVCLGTGIRSAFSGPVITTLDQSLIQGEVWTDSSQAALSQGRHVLTGVRWLQHGPWGFVFPQSTLVNVELGPKIGSWDLIGTHSAASAERDVFLAYLAHGETPERSNYAYMIVADASRGLLDRISKEPSFQIVANNEFSQVVWWPAAHLLQAQFFTAGEVSWAPGYSLQVDRECAVMLRQEDSGAWVLTAADTQQIGGVLKVALNEPSHVQKQGTLIFPEGDHLGRTACIRF